VALGQRLFDLWSVPPDTHADPVEAFRRLYTDPVMINGVSVPVVELVARARALHEAFTDHVIDVVEQVSASGKLAIAFRHTARHTGVWATPLGDIAPTGRTVSGLGIDVLSIDSNGRVTGIWVLADELQRIMQVSDSGTAT
jgi:hypothetical protein